MTRSIAGDGGMYARIWETDTQTIASGDTDPLDFDKAASSPDFDVSNGDTSITIPRDGVYLLLANAFIQDGEDEANLNYFLQVNGNNVVEGGNGDPDTVGNLAGAMGTVRELEAGDTVRVDIQNKSSLAVTTLGEEQGCQLSVAQL